MGFLAGKRILLTGLLSNRSIAYGIAKACHREGAELALTYQNERFADRIAKLAEAFGSKLVLQCDVAVDAQIHALFAVVCKRWDGLDSVVHCIAFAAADAIGGDFLTGISREACRVASDMSSYRCAALAKGARALLQGRNGSLLGLCYLGAEGTKHNYITM